MPVDSDFSSESSDLGEVRRDNDPDFAFGESYESGHRGGDVHTDKPYDEAIEVDASDENVSTPDSSPTPGKAAAAKDTSFARSTEPDYSRGSEPLANAKQLQRRQDDDSETETETSSSGDEEESKHPGQYDPNEFSQLNVTPEVQELFQYIGRYKPHTVDLETHLKPFIPDFIPAVGEVDGFIKIPRPDAKESTLGLTKLDEPCLNPSDPTVLDLQLRSISKHSNMQPMEVRSIENAERSPKEIANWITRISDLHRMKPPANVQYAKRMPDIEQLMQVWPTAFEEFIDQNPLQHTINADLDLPLDQYVKLLAVILDVPVHNNCTDTLHVLFTLYSEFKNHPHFGPAFEGEGGVPVNPMA